MMERKSITIAGNIIVDQNKYIETYPHEGHLSYVNNSYSTMGGCVPNTSVTLKSIDQNLDVRALGSIGKDEDGQYALSYFKEHNINTENVEILENEKTSHVDAYINTSNAKRTFFVQQGASKSFGKKLLPVTTTHLHVGYLLLLPYMDEILENGRTRMSFWLEEQQKKGIIISCDMVSEESDRYQKVITSALPFINYMIINEIEASKLAGIEVYQDNILSVDQLILCAKAIKAMGIKNAVIIHAPHLGLIYDGKDSYVLSSLKVPHEDIVNSVGAGDAFCAATLYGILNDYQPYDILRLASCVAADVLMSQTPKPNLKDLKSFFALENKYGRR